MDKSRLFFIDNLRILLITLVIAHHVAITYGAEGLWYYYEGSPDPITSTLLTWFVATNQAFFMGLFFLISGYFTPGSYDRKKAGVFLKDRFVRLGIPLVFYVIIIDPIIVYLRDVTIYGIYMSFLDFYALRISRLDVLDLGKSINVGPLWFVEALLIFALVYSLYRLLRKPPDRNLSQDRSHDSSKNKVPGNMAIISFILVLSVISFMVRLVYPIGEDFLFLQLGFFPQYITLFTVGIVAYRRNWIQKISVTRGKLWLTIAVIGILLLPIVLVLRGREVFVSHALGGMYYESIFYAIWESFVGIGLIIGLLVLFRTKYNHQGNLAKAMSADAYTAYIIFTPVIIILSLAIVGVNLHPIVKFALVSLGGISICFFASHYIRKFPGAKKIL